MLKSLVNTDPFTELRTMEEMFDRMFGTPWRNTAMQAASRTSAILPVDVIERDNSFIIRAAVPGVAPEDLDVSIENHVLTVRGELKNEWESQDVKVYHREYSYGTFARSIRLPENLNLEAIDAEFKNGFVTITIPKKEEEKPKALRVNVRTGENGVIQTPSIESGVKNGKGK